MIFVKNSVTSTQGEVRFNKGFEFIVVSYKDDVQRILLEGSDFRSFPEVLQHVSSIRDAVNQGLYRVERDVDTRMYGFLIFGSARNPEESILASEFGWTDTSEVNEFMSELKEALKEGPKVV